MSSSYTSYVKTVSDDGTPDYNDDYGVFDPANASGEEIIELRTAPFGPPKDRDNEPYNPGRQQYSSEKGSSYSTREPRKFFFLNEMTQYNTKDNWQSGPCDNDPARDHVSEHAGYWTSPGGENCDWNNYKGPGDPHKPTTFSMTIVSNKKKNLIYNIGHGDWLSTSEGVDYGVVGISGHVGATFDLNYRGRGQPDGLSSVGIQHIYCMYRADIEEDEIPPLVEEMEEMEKWLLEIQEMMDEIFPAGIPDNLEEQIEAALNNNNQIPDGDSAVNGYSTRTITSVLSGERLQKLKNITFEKNDTTFKILEILMELMGRSFNGAGKVSKTSYNADLSADYIMGLFKSPAEYDFDDFDPLDYNEDTEIITGVEVLMWLIHEFFGAGNNNNIETLLSIIQQGSISTASNRVSRDFLTETITAYHTSAQDQEPDWDAYGIVTFYDSFWEGQRYLIHNANDYRIALWWSNPGSEFTTGESIYGGIVDPGVTVELPPLGHFLKIAAVDPNFNRRSWGSFYGRTSKVFIGEATSTYSYAPEDIGTPEGNLNATNYKLYAGLGYYQHSDGQKPKWGATVIGAGLAAPGSSKQFYHNLWKDPDVELEPNNGLTNTNKGHQTPCTWALPCKTQYTNEFGDLKTEDSRYVLYLPKSAPYKRIALWVCDVNYNLNSEETGSGKPNQWYQLHIMKAGQVYELGVRNNTNPLGIINGKAHSFYRIGVLPSRKNGKHYFEDPVVRQKSIPGRLDPPPVAGIFTGAILFPTRGITGNTIFYDGDVSTYIKHCNTAKGEVKLVDMKILEDGRKMATFQCMDYEASVESEVIIGPIYVTDDYKQPDAVPIEPQKPSPTVNFTSVPTVKYNDDPGTWRNNGGKDSPRNGESDFYYVKDKGYIIYWNYVTNKWVEKSPSKYRFEVASINKTVPTVLDKDQEGDLCIMRTPWGNVYSGTGNPDPDFSEQFESTSNSAGFAYIYLDGNWKSIGNVAAYKNTAAVPDDKHINELLLIHNNSNIDINYDDPENPGNNLHVNDRNPNHMLYIKDDGRNSSNPYSSNKYNLIGYLDEQDDNAYDTRNIYMHPAGTGFEVPLPGYELVWTEKRYDPAFIGNPGSTGDPDYMDFVNHGEMHAYDIITKKWCTWPSKGMKTRDGNFKVAIDNPKIPPTGPGQFHLNKTSMTLFVSWRINRNELKNDGFEYVWERIEKKVDNITSDSTIVRQRASDGDKLRVAFRNWGGNYLQLICGNTNQDPTKKNMLIVGGDPSEDGGDDDNDDRVLDGWRYFKTRSEWERSYENITSGSRYYDYIEERGLGHRIYRVTKDTAGSPGVVATPILVNQSSNRRVTATKKISPTHTDGDTYMAGTSDYYPVPDPGEGYLPTNIWQPCNGGDSLFYSGMLSFKDDTGDSFLTLTTSTWKVETKRENISGDGITGTPIGNYNDILDKEPFLIYKNPDEYGAEPVWKYFSQTVAGTPIGWKMIIGGQIRDQSNNGENQAKVDIGNVNGSYGNSTESSLRPDTPLGYRSRSTSDPNSQGGIAPSGPNGGSDYYDEDAREYRRRPSGEGGEFKRDTRVPNPNGASISIGDVYIISKDNYDHTKDRPADGTRGRDSDVPNYDKNQLYVVTRDEDGNRAVKHVGYLYDTGDRTGVTNVPPNLNTQSVYVQTNELKVVTAAAGVSTYTTMEGDAVMQETGTDPIPGSEQAPAPILGSGTPTEPPAPAVGEPLSLNEPVTQVDTSTQYDQTEIQRPGGPTTASEVIVDEQNVNRIKRGFYLWQGDVGPDGQPSFSSGKWIDLAGSSFTLGPTLPRNESTQVNDGDLHIQAASENSNSGRLFQRINGEMRPGPSGNTHDNTVNIVRDGDSDRYRPASAPGDLRVRIQEPDPEDPADDTERRVVLEVATETDEWRPISAGESFDEDEDIVDDGLVTEYQDPNTRYYWGDKSERPDWSIYKQLWTWELNDKEYFISYHNLGNRPTGVYDRAPVDRVNVWTSDRNSYIASDWTKVGTLLPGDFMSESLPKKKYVRIAVHTQKSPNVDAAGKNATTAGEWNKNGHRIPFGISLHHSDPSVKDFTESVLNNEWDVIDLRNDSNTGAVIKTMRNRSTGAEISETYGGWEKQFSTTGPGAEVDGEDGLTEKDEDGNPIANYGPEVITKPQGVSEVKTLPKLGNKIGDALFLKDPTQPGGGRLYVYDGKEGNDGWAKVGTKRCPNTKNPAPGDYPGHPYWHTSRKKPYVWDGKEYVNPVRYHPKDEDGNPITPDEPSGDGDREIDIEPGEAVGILTALGEASAYAAIFAGAILAAKAVGAVWLKKMETDFLAECTEFEAGHELPIGFGSSEVDTFCKWYDLNHKFINMTIKPELRLITQLLRCRFNGYMFHLAHVGPGKQEVRQLKVHSIVPTYSWGLIEMENHRVLRVIREFSRNATRSSTDKHQWGVQVDKSIKLDTRKRLINQQGVMTEVPAVDENGNNIYNEETGQLETITRPWLHTDAWFKPQTSVCLRTTGQEHVYTKAGERYQIGDLGLEWIKAEGTTSGHPEISGMNAHRTGPGLYVMNIFNDIGAGSKYYEHYNTNNSCHAWVWEVLAHEPKPFPLPFIEDEMQVGLEFDLGSINVNRDQPRAARDWQINFMHMSFEDQNGEMKSIKIMPTGGYTFRNSEAFGTPSTHLMGQLENDMYRRVTCWSNDTINVNDRFWGFAIQAWIGTEYAADRWRCYNIKNLKPLLRIPQ